MLHVGTEWAYKTFYFITHQLYSCPFLRPALSNISAAGSTEKKTETVIIVAVQEMDFEAVK